MTFPYFVMKKAPVSHVESLMNYQATIFGEYREATEMAKVVVRPRSLPLLEEDIGLRRAISARTSRDGEAQRAHVARGIDRHRGKGSPASVRDFEAAG